MYFIFIFMGFLNIFTIFKLFIPFKLFILLFFYIFITYFSIYIFVLNENYFHFANYTNIYFIFQQISQLNLIRKNI